MSAVTDTPVGKFGQPVLNDENGLKLALFGINLRGGVTLSDVEGKVEATWEENRRLAQHADRIVHLFDGLIVEEEAGANRREIEDAKRELKESGFGDIA